MASYDDLLKTIGEFGRYQKLVFFAVCLTAIPSAFNNLGIVFLAAVPDHWCLSPSADHLNLSRADLLNLTVPLSEEDDSGTTYSRCKRYDRNYTGWTPDQVREALAAGPDTGVAVTDCQDGWKYDTSQYKSTIVTQWDLVCDKKVLVATASSVYMAGLMVGVLFFGTLSDMIGRKVAFCGSLFMTVILAISLSFSPNYITFIILRFLVASANMGLFTTAFVLGIEMVGPKWRVFAGIVIEYFWASGYIILAGIAYGIREWFHLSLAISIPCVLLFILPFFLPESPRWLYSQNKHERADTIVRKMAKVNGVELPDKLDIEVRKDARAYVWDLLRYPRLRLRSLNIFFNWFVNSLVYYGLSLNTSNLGGNDYINFAISGAVEIPAYLFCQISLQYLGRRWNLAGTMFVGGVSLLCILAVPKDLNVIAIVLAMIGKFCISASFAIIYVFSAELFPTVVRNVGVGAGSFWARVGGIIAPYIGSLIDISPLIPYITFGTLSIAAAILSLFLPETKGRKLPQTIEDGENFTTRPDDEEVLEAEPQTELPEKSGTANPAYDGGSPALEVENPGFEGDSPAVGGDNPGFDGERTHL